MAINTRSRNKLTLTKDTVLAVKAGCYVLSTGARPFWTTKYVALGRKARKRHKPLVLSLHIRKVKSRKKPFRCLKQES